MAHQASLPPPPPPYTPSTEARLPEPLKGRILRAVHLRVHDRFDTLVDTIYERYEDRLFENERVIVALGNDRYAGLVVRVFPPQRLAELAQSRAAAAGHHPDAILPENVWGNTTAYGAVAHAIGTDLDIDADEGERLDPAHGYVYIIQLMDEHGGFQGSTVEARAPQLTCASHTLNS
jgi:bromodomain adjacent to zinc finger domain protein 1A